MEKVKLFDVTGANLRKIEEAYPALSFAPRLPDKPATTIGLAEESRSKRGILVPLGPSGPPVMILVYGSGEDESFIVDAYEYQKAKQKNLVFYELGKPGSSKDIVFPQSMWNSKLYIAGHASLGKIGGISISDLAFLLIEKGLPIDVKQIDLFGCNTGVLQMGGFGNIIPAAEFRERLLYYLGRLRNITVVSPSTFRVMGMTGVMFSNKDTSRAGDKGNRATYTRAQIKEMRNNLSANFKQIANQPGLKKTPEWLRLNDMETALNKKTQTVADLQLLIKSKQESRIYFPPKHTG